VSPSKSAGRRSIGDIMNMARVIPVLSIECEEDAVPLAEALVGSGLSVLEVTLRTDAALAAASAILAEVHEAVVGLGTLLTADEVESAHRIGADFIVSPGLTETLADAARQSGLPFLPGVATASEAMRAVELGYTHLKFFPAEASGGVAALKALYGPLPGLRFCPTGGITIDSVSAYLRLPNVLCVGGSWMVPAAEVGERDWSAIQARAWETMNVAR